MSRLVQCKRVLNIRRISAVLSLSLLFLIALAWRAFSGGQAIIGTASTWVPTWRGHSHDAVSIIFLVGDHDHQIMEATRAILALTVGPYELIAVCPVPSSQTSGRSSSGSLIVDRLVNRYLSYQIKGRYNAGRGLSSLLIIEQSATSDYELDLERAVASAQYAQLAFVDSHQILNDFGWDRMLFRGLRSASNLLAVSGRSAASLRAGPSGDGDQQVWLYDKIVGQPDLRGSSISEPWASTVNLRHVATGSPIMYDRQKLLQLGGYERGLVKTGLSDIDLCLRGRYMSGYTCGYYPISTLRPEHWVSVPGHTTTLAGSLSAEYVKSLPFVLDETTFDMTTDELPKIEPDFADSPLTVVTASSANHAATLRNMLDSRHFSPHTRFVVYELPSRQKMDIHIFGDMPNVLFRVFDFNRYPSWMDIDTNRGEYAWKAQIIQEIALEHGGLVFWQDAGNLMLSDMGQTWRDIALRGFYSTETAGDIEQWTHPGTLAYLGIPRTLWSRRNCNGAILAMNTLDRRTMALIAEPFFSCSSDRDCIAPLGSHRNNHRQDQAAMTCLIYLAGYDCSHQPPISIHNDIQGEGSVECLIDGNETSC